MSAEPEVVYVGLIQMACSPDKEQNLQVATQRIAEAAAQGAQVVCLPELFATPYPCQSEDHGQFDLAEPIPGPTSERLSQAAAAHGVTLIGSLFERRAAGVYHNTAVLHDSRGELIGRYRKMHIPDDPLYYEKFYFTPGDGGFPSFPSEHAVLGVCVCWDQWFPEAARLTALAGAELLFFPTAIGWLPDEKETFGPSQCEAWETMMRSHAIANGVFAVAVNRVGREGELEFWGRSFVADPYGNVLARAEGEQTLVVPCDLRLIETARRHWPFFRDRRTDAYEGLLRRFGNE